jgi:acylphosphatase
MQRREVYYSGDVQGVGFRYTARRVAEGYPVTGFVRNLADGRVQLVVEGPEAEVAAFLSELERVMHGYIRHVATETVAPRGEFTGFAIRH